MASVLTRRFLLLFHGQCRSASEEVWLSPLGMWGGGQRLKVGRRRDGMWVGGAPHSTSLCRDSARQGSSSRGAERDRCGTAVAKAVASWNELLSSPGSGLGLAAARGRGRGPVSDRSLLSEGTGQVGRPCPDQVSSPVSSFPQPGATRLTAARSSQAGGRVARPARRRNRAQTGGPSAEEG